MYIVVAQLSEACGVLANSGNTHRHITSLGLLPPDGKPLPRLEHEVELLPQSLQVHSVVTTSGESHGGGSPRFCAT